MLRLLAIRGDKALRLSYNVGVTRGLTAGIHAVATCGAALLCLAPAVAEGEEKAVGRSWAFEPPAPVEAPPTEAPWIRTPVDGFVWQRLQAQGLRPSADAAKERLLRRVSLDLTGLPPSPDQAAAFLGDPTSGAYERLVSSLMASPHYGERWAQKWLDVVRYADTNGFEMDAYREHAWRYRDYVVRSFNEDKPYDRFIQEQVAGDELFPDDPDALVATGFHGAGPRHVVGGNQDKEEARQEVLTEMTLGVGQALLGLTVQCARCHDHKFDPIKQAEYYQLESFFSGTELQDVPTADDVLVAELEKAAEEHEARLKPIQDRIEAIEEPYKDQVRKRKRAALGTEHAMALDVPEAERTEEQERLADEANAQIKPVWYEVVALLPDDVSARRSALRKQIHELELQRPDPPPAAFAVANLDDADETHILQGGDHRRKGVKVRPGFLEVLGDLGIAPPGGSTGRRSALARWLTHPENPLTARVMVNRIWEFRMGRGLMQDPNNFGALGGRPSHPALLDSLARRFMQEGWSVKAVDRLIVLSSAYRQSSAIATEQAAIDPDNRWYWRADRRRLSGEAIRDGALAATGALNRSLGGKPVRIPIEREVYDLIFTEAEPDNLWPVTPDLSQHRRRSLYLLNKRTVRLPFLANFDQPDTMTSCSVRSTSTHALQSLSLLNSDFMQDQSRLLAERLVRLCGDADAGCQVDRAFRLTLAREPTVAERQLAQGFLGSHPKALRDFSLALLNRNEFVYRP